MSKLDNVILHSDVYTTCMIHSLSVEKEEVMGLLVGEVIGGTSYILSSIILHRSDKAQDRVEISDAQLTEGMNYAEELQKVLKRPVRIVGWYHSHPHITVWPSHVDTQTQLNYQLLDSQFVGLIFSVFSYDKRHMVNKVEMTCYQASNTNNKILSREVPIRIEPAPLSVHNLQVMANLPHILSQEHEDMYQKYDESQGDELVKIHNEAVRKLHSINVVSTVAWPLYKDLFSTRLKTTNLRIKQLKAYKEELIRKRDEKRRSKSSEAAGGSGLDT